MNEEELKLYANAQKEKYIAGDIEHNVKKLQNIDRILLKDQRDFFGENNYTDEEIEEIIMNRNYILPEDYAMLNRMYDPNSMSNHALKSGGVDLRQACEMIRRKELEHLVYIVLDGERNILGYIVAEGHEYDIGNEVIQAASRKLICDYPEAKEVIMMHNHPHLVVAEPSFLDGRMAMKIKVALDLFGIKLIDDCVVTEVDFYSRKWAEMNKGKGYDNVYGNILPEQLKKKIKKVNPNMGVIIF